MAAVSSTVGSQTSIGFAEGVAGQWAEEKKTSDEVGISAVSPLVQETSRNCVREVEGDGHAAFRSA